VVAPAARAHSVHAVGAPQPGGVAVRCAADPRARRQRRRNPRSGIHLAAADRGDDRGGESGAARRQRRERQPPCRRAERVHRAGDRGVRVLRVARARSDPAPGLPGDRDGRTRVGGADSGDLGIRGVGCARMGSDPAGEHHDADDRGGRPRCVPDLRADGALRQSHLARHARAANTRGVGAGVAAVPPRRRACIDGERVPRHASGIFTWAMGGCGVSSRGWVS